MPVSTRVVLAGEYAKGSPLTVYYVEPDTPEQISERAKRVWYQERFRMPINSNVQLAGGTRESREVTILGSIREYIQNFRPHLRNGQFGLLLGGDLKVDGVEVDLSPTVEAAEAEQRELSVMDTLEVFSVLEDDDEAATITPIALFNAMQTAATRLVTAFEQHGVTVKAYIAPRPNADSEQSWDDYLVQLTTGKMSGAKMRPPGTVWLKEVTK